MTTEATTQGIEGHSKRKNGLLLTLALGAALAALVALAGTARQAEAAFSEKIVFSSNRTTGTGVNNPTGDYEIFKMNPDGTGVRQLTANAGYDLDPILSPDGKKIVYESYGIQNSNPEGDIEVYVMNSADGSGKKNLSNNGSGVNDSYPIFSPSGTRIAYESYGIQNSNPEGDEEVYVMRTADGLGKKNLTDNGADVYDYQPAFSPSGTKIAYSSQGIQPSNQEGDEEAYIMNASDGLGKKNLSNNGADVYDYRPVFSPSGTRIAYTSEGIQNSNPEGDEEVYRVNVADGLGKKNLTDNGTGVNDRYPVFSPSGTRLAYHSSGVQPSNPEGDQEVYRLNVADGLGKKNLSNNGTGVQDNYPVFSPSGTRIAYQSSGVQPSNPEGDQEVYRLNVADGLGKKNLTDNGTGVLDYPSHWGMQAT